MQSMHEIQKSYFKNSKNCIQTIFFLCVWPVERNFVSGTDVKTGFWVLKKIILAVFISLCILLIISIIPVAVGNYLPREILLFLSSCAASPKYDYSKY